MPFDPENRMLVAKDVSKKFVNPSIQVLFDISIEIPGGDFAAITGRSGSGKSTLLYILSSLDTPTSGSVLVDGIDLVRMTSEEIHEFRNEKMGFVFQFHYLLPELTAIENVLMPARKLRRHTEFRSRAMALLEQMGLKERIHSLPRQLSGGEQQRVAIARALIMEPRYLFADEPTGNLDSLNGKIVMDLLQGIASNGRTTVIFVTHDREFASTARHQIELADGRVVGDSLK